MSAIPCASVNLKTMADGTLRISFDIEPMHAQDAFRLFAAPGTPAAIAALQVGYAAVDPVQPVIGNPTTKPAIGPLCMLAVQWCRMPEFWAWLETDPDNAARSEHGAASCVQAMCEVESRKELDTNPEAAARFHRMIRGPFTKYMQAKGG